MQAAVSDQQAQAPAAEGQPKKTRRTTAHSMANLQHKKQCPWCSKSFGNAKRGRCGGLDGQCSYEFVLSKRAKTAAKHPPRVEIARAVDVAHWEKFQEKFKELSQMANELAVETGWSFLVTASGVTAPEIVGGPNLYVESYQSMDNPSSSLQVGVLRHGVGGAAAEIAQKPEMLQMQARLTLADLAGKLGDDIKPDAAQDPAPGIPMGFPSV